MIDTVRGVSIASALRPLSLAFLAVLTVATAFTWKHTSHEALSVSVTPSPKPVIVIDATPTVFEQELAMSPQALMTRWDPMIEEAAKRFHVPATWIRAVMRVESGGRTMQESGPITSPVGAMGLMQVMPDTYAEMRQQYNLGADAYDPHNNILAGAAYLRWLKAKFGFPAMFAAYNNGPTKFQTHLATGAALPGETVNYVDRVGSILGIKKADRAAVVTAAGAQVSFTMPDGKKFAVDASKVTAVSPALTGEYAPGVNAVLHLGKKRQGVREDVVIASALIRKHGGKASL